MVFNAAGFGFIPEYSSFQFKAVYDINRNNILSFNGIGNIDKVRFNNNSEENKQKNEGILQNNQWGYTNAFELKSLISPKSYSLINLTRNYTNYDFAGRDANFTENFKNLSTEGETSLKVEYFWNPGYYTQISFGGSGKYINFKNEIKKASDTLYVIDPITGQRTVIPALNFTSSNITYKADAFVQLTQRVMNIIKFNLGLRYDYFDFINDKNYISPRTSVVFNVNRKLNFNFSYGIFYQSPSSAI